MRGKVAVLATFFFLGLASSLEVSQPPEKLRCIPGIKRFSKRDSETHFYECSNNEEPILKECPGELFYNMRKQLCVTKEEQKKALPIDDKALGRNFQLGSMYDARRNMFFPDASLWNKTTIDNNIFEYDRRNVDLEVTASKRTLEKTDSMDISAHLTLDFMSGMVHVAGSAGYLKDDITSEDEVNVEMTYHSTTHAKTLPKETILSYKDECTNSAYTHVVTSVTYGLDAVFVFKKLLESHETDDQVTGSLEIAINKIPGAAIEGEGQINITDSDLEVMNHTSLKIYGDFSPSTPVPTTYDAAVEFYRQVPDYAKDGGQIIELHLTPVTDVCTPEDFILNDLSDEMMGNVIKMLDELEQLDTKVTGLINSRQSQKFKPLRDNLNLYRKALRSYVLDVKMKLGSILPNIRGGDGHGEDDLIIMIGDYVSSQFYFDTSSEFLIDRNREIQAIRFLEENFPSESNLAIADYESANDVEYIFKRDQVVVLEFNILTPEDLTISFLSGHPINESGFWYNDVSINGHVGELLRDLSDFGLENVDQENKGYLVKVNLMNDNPYIMSALIDGNVRSDLFEVPKTPTTPIPYALTHESFAFSVKKYNEFTTGVRIFVTNNINGKTFREDRMFPEETSAGDNVEIVMDGLLTANIYRLSIKYLTEVGTSPASPETESFALCATSKPQALLVDELTSDAIKIVWQSPANLADGLDETDLLYKLHIEGENGFEKTVLTEEKDYILHEPLDATKYRFSVNVVIEKTLGVVNPDDPSVPSNSSKLNLETEVFDRDNIITEYVISKPLPPKLDQVEDSEVSQTSALLKWTQPEVADGADIMHYVLTYTAMNENGTEAFSGTEGELILKETTVELSDLSPGATYEFRVKVKTSEGESDFSMGLMFATKFEDAELEQARTEIFGAIQDVEGVLLEETNFCAHTEKTNAIGTVIFDAILFLNENNIDDANFDVYKGIFTAGAAGRYKITIGSEMLSSSGQDHYLWLRRNGLKMEGSKMHTGRSMYVTGTGTDIGSRELILDLNTGDTLSLEHYTEGPSDILSITFCVSSIEF